MSISITVRYFAALREQLGLAHERVGIEVDGASLADLMAALSRRHGAAAEALRSPRLRVARNRAFVDGNFLLSDGDEIAFLPPVTGG